MHDQESIYTKKDVYKQIDLFFFYEGTRFTIPFIVYRNIASWASIDRLATYGHVMYSCIIIITALFYGVNVFMAINVLCICGFYALAVRRLVNRAVKN